MAGKHCKIAIAPLRALVLFLNCGIILSTLNEEPRSKLEASMLAGIFVG
jgi:hypothetical protein